MKICIDCGTPATATRCPEHQARADRKPSSTARGYNNRWRVLSEKARRLQPWCLDCGTDTDLTTDHSTQAWERHNAGLAIRLIDVEVVCRSCNAKRGQARPTSNTRGDTPLGYGPRPGGKAQRQSLLNVQERGEL